jgi:hypothetical protein
LLLAAHGFDSKRREATLFGEPQIDHMTYRISGLEPSLFSRPAADRSGGH